MNFAAWLVPCLLLNPVASGPRSGVEAQLFIDGGSFELELRADFDALLVGLSPGSPVQDRLQAIGRLDGERLDVEISRLQRYVHRRIRVRFDEIAAPLTVDFPGARTTASGEFLSLGSRARLRGAVPARARRVSFFASRSFGPVLFTVCAEGASTRQLLAPGERSAPFALAVP